MNEIEENNSLGQPSGVAAGTSESEEVDAQIAEVLEEFDAAHRLLKAGLLDDYSGQFVAFLNCQVAGAGEDGEDLRLRISQQRGVDPERIAVIFIPDVIVI